MPEKRIESMPPFGERAGEALPIPEGGEEGLGESSLEERPEVSAEGEVIRTQEPMPGAQDEIPTAQTLVSGQKGPKVHKNMLERPPRDAGAAELEQTLEALFKSRASEEK